MTRDEMIRWLEGRGYHAEWTLVPDAEVLRWFEDLWAEEKV